MRQVQSVGPERLQSVRPALGKAGTQRGRSAEQVQQHKGVAPEIARGAVRVSLGAGNSETDVDNFINALQVTVGRLQGLTVVAV